MGQALECSSVRLSSPHLTKTKKNIIARSLYKDKKLLKANNIMTAFLVIIFETWKGFS